MFSHLMHWYLYIIFGAVAPWQKFAMCRSQFVSKYCVLLYWQHYCTALEQWAPAKLQLGTRNGITELHRGRPLYSAGRASPLVSAHILVVRILLYVYAIVLDQLSVSRLLKTLLVLWFFPLNLSFIAFIHSSRTFPYDKVKSEEQHRWQD